MDVPQVSVLPVERVQQASYQERMEQAHCLGALPKIGEALWYVPLKPLIEFVRTTIMHDMSSNRREPVSMLLNMNYGLRYTAADIGAHVGQV